jgi:excinuclease ABC subunit C
MTFNSNDFLKHLTHSPGVYQMLDENGQILYVGKAKNLKKRVASYFRRQLDHPKTAALVKKIHDIRILATANENAALLLENDLIKQYRPRYNILFKDDKSFPYLHLTHHPYPRLTLYRGPQKPLGDYFGPYASVQAVREALNLLQKCFLIRNCSDSFFNNRSRPCLQHHIQRCSAPCVQKISPEDYRRDIEHAKAFLHGHTQDILLALGQRMNQAAADQAYEKAAFFRDQIQCLHQLDKEQHSHQAHGQCDVFAIVAEESHCAVQVLHIRLGKIIGNRHYLPANADAQSLDDILNSFVAQFYLTDNGREIPDKIFVNQTLPDQTWLSNVLSQQANRHIKIYSQAKTHHLAWLKQAEHNARLALTSHLASTHLSDQRFAALSQLLQLEPKASWRLECFDISHSLGEATVASNVVFDQHGPRKSAYRLYNIEGLTPGDDYAAMAQALKRRFSGSQRDMVPDVLLIDGGRGQLNAAKAVLAELPLVPLRLIGIAKGEGRKPGLETLWIEDDQTAVQLPAHSHALHLLQHLRDEAHRFAITRHRAKRRKTRQSSALEQLAGIGQKKRQMLLSFFGGLSELKKASVEELQKVPGIGPALALKIRASLVD